ncbi:MAG TPA: PP0621 family protein [Noviherbaspirillum sp.]|nr:PP0621 family protein [Noviherbaspirillum sp.]
MRLFAWVLLILVVLWVLRSNKSAGRASDGQTAGAGTESMVQCAHCGIYVPVSESVAGVSGRSYCSEEHRLRHAT